MLLHDIPKEYTSIEVSDTDKKVLLALVKEERDFKIKVHHGRVVNIYYTSPYTGNKMDYPIGSWTYAYDTYIRDGSVPTLDQFNMADYVKHIEYA